VNQQLALELNLKLASASSIVQVDASALEVLHTTDASVGEVISARPTASSTPRNSAPSAKPPRPAAKSSSAHAFLFSESAQLCERQGLVARETPVTKIHLPASYPRNRRYTRSKSLLREVSGYGGTCSMRCLRQALQFEPFEIAQAVGAR